MLKSDTNNSILSGLNPAQAEAVIQGGAPLLVLAGAGSGKTKVLTHRIAHMIENGCNPANILAVTFTNKAAKEMKLRVSKLVGEDKIKGAWLGTFHSVCALMLRMDIDKLPSNEEGRLWTKNFVIYDETDSVNTIKEALKALELDPKLYAPKSIKARISNAKNEGKTAKEFAEGAKASNYREEKISEIFFKYEELMARNNALDFDDLLLFTVTLLEKNQDVRDYYHSRFKHILVDEYQDTNITQYKMIRLLSEGSFFKSSKVELPEAHWQSRTLTVVGDVDQSIYSWRGADFRIIINFQTDYPQCELIKLEHNYRSTGKILAVADKIIANNEERIEKNLIATKSEGDNVTVFEAQDELEEAHYIVSEIRRRVANEGKQLKDFAVLYRTNVQSRVIEEALLKQNMPYVIVGGFRFYERKEIKDIVAYLKILHNPADAQSLKRIINEPRRGIGATTVSKVEDFAETQGFSLYKCLLEIDDVPNLSLSVKNKIKDFVDLIEELRLAEKSLEVGDLVDQVVNKTGYFEMLQKSSDAEADSKMENVHELIGVATNFSVNSEEPSLETFLAEISLLGDVDNAKFGSNSVTMMTLHSAKGLEFPIVFLGGLEEGIFPHQRSLDSQDTTQLEEERRLMYVGVTRAEEKLYISYARRRRIFGQSDFAIPSRFLEEAPRDCLTGYYGQSSTNDRSSYHDDGRSTIGGARYSKKIQNQLHEEQFSDEIVHYQKTSFQKPKQKEVIKNGYENFDDGWSSPSFSSKPAKKPSPAPTNVSSPKTVWTAPRDAAPAAKNLFKPGDKVEHAKFGKGEVTQIMGSGQKVLYSVKFPDIGNTKLLDPKFAKLIKLD